MTVYSCSRIAMFSIGLVAASTVVSVPTVPAGPTPDGVTAPRADAPKQTDDKSDLPSSSEELIAAALKAGTITYEESLRQRAFAIYGNPRVDLRFRSPIIDWEAGRPLFAEIEQKEATLSKGVLADLAPFRARPNDPISVFNRPRSGKAGARRADEAEWIRRVATGGTAQSSCTTIRRLAEDWESDLVLGTNVRVWIPKAYESELGTYKAMVGEVWHAFPAYFSHPLSDNGNPCDETNPDSAVDIYFVMGSTVDPRKSECQANPGLRECTTNNYEAGGFASTTPSTSSLSGYSGYALVDIERSTDDNKYDKYDLIAHELAHISQFAYDAFESGWLRESTATWVAYKVMNALEKEPQAYRYISREFVSRDLNPLFPYLHDSLDAEPFKYAAWLFFYSASIDLGDNIVNRVWEKARRTTRDHIFAVDDTIPLIEYFLTHCPPKSKA